ncbi:MAG: type II toxin-antitoxin system prevent-host-death family antitoxin [Planctomycetes bacterium]|nr:type II toxin-antitoxin system prevent-host-death family antitoxin [Planctomycetota bacterium]
MKIAAGEFKAKCLKLLDEVERDGGEIIITKRGRPVARLVPLREATKKKKKSTYGCMKGTVKILGDIISPLDVEWEALQ